MSEKYPLPRSPAGRTVQRWSRPLRLLSESRREVIAFSAVNPKWKPMAELYEHLCELCGTELYGGAIMGGGLGLAARADVQQYDGVIVIYFDPSKRRFSLSYRHCDVEPEQTEECPQEYIWARLRLYLGYKFGVRIAQH